MNEILWSKSRVYLPLAGQWLSYDSSLLENPESLTGHTGNWEPAQYGNGDPLNFVDPSGQFAVTTALLTVGGVNAIAMGSAWVASKVAMWAGGTNTPQMNAQLNQGMLVGVGAGFAPAAVVGGGQLMMGAGRMGSQAMDIAAKTAYMTSPSTFTKTMDFISGYSDPALPRGKWDTAGWAVDNWDNITFTFEKTYDCFSDFSFGRESYQDDGFRFYDQTPSNDSYSFGAWEF